MISKGLNYSKRRFDTRLNIEDWEKFVAIGTVVWMFFFMIDFLAYDHDLFCIEQLGLDKTALCISEPLIESPEWYQPYSEKITLLIVGFFVFDLGFKVGKTGNVRKFLSNKGNIFDIIITIPFFWILEPHEIMRTLRFLKVFKVVNSVVKKYRETKLKKTL